MATGKDANAVKVGPGRLYIAQIGTTEPTSLSGALDAGWIPLGYTSEGSEFSFGREAENVEVAEEINPIRTVVTNQTITAAFALAQLTAKNLSWVLGGGTVTVGAADTKFEAPEPGDELYFMLLWQDAETASANTERMLFRKTFQTGETSIPRRKGSEKAVLPATFTAYKPAAAKTFTYWTTVALSGQ